MACYLLTETMSRRHQLGMESYDRLFPNQDTLRRGGFGNLIALPLQHEPRQSGNTVFVDERLVPHPDQWAFLATVSRIDPDTVERLARDATRAGQVLGVRWTDGDAEDDEAAPWSRAPSRRGPPARLPGPVPRGIRSVLAQKLVPVQEQAARALLSHDAGVFVAPPGVGRTVVGTYLVAARGRSTLVLVHRQPLLDQWVAQLGMFLGLHPKSDWPDRCGQAQTDGSARRRHAPEPRPAGRVDDVVAGYGHVIVDECHHVPAVSFERVLSEVKARYLTGLTATPRRRDGLHPILEMQLGSVRYAVDAKSQAAHRPFEHRLIVRETTFIGGALDPAQGIQTLYAALAGTSAGTS